MDQNTLQQYKFASGLALFTIIYNIAEGLISTYLGYSDDSLALFGFGLDSFIETISGIGIFHMVSRIRANPGSKRDEFECRALKVTGFSFYALSLGLFCTAAYNVFSGKQPEATFYGLVIALVSILIMLILIRYKTKVGKALNSAAIIADAECTKVCIYMSIVLLVSSGIYHFTRIPYTDSAGACLLAYLSFKEGRECFEKANTNSLCSCDAN